MAQIASMESYASEDPAVIAWREAFIETARIIPEAVETIATKIGNILLKTE